MPRCFDGSSPVRWDRRDLLGISQNELARRAGVSSSHLSQIMAGNSNPSLALLRKLHAVLFEKTGNEGLT